MEAARELLNFGLRGANLETLAAIDICDNDKFVTSDIDDDWQTLDQITVSLRQVSKTIYDNMFYKIHSITYIL